MSTVWYRFGSCEIDIRSKLKGFGFNMLACFVIMLIIQRAHNEIPARPDSSVVHWTCRDSLDTLTGRSLYHARPRFYGKTASLEPCVRCVRYSVQHVLSFMGWDGIPESLAMAI
jgi:hypothetical protein